MPTVEFPGRFDSLAGISDFVRAAAIAAGLDDDAVYGVELAVDEACSNIIEHAYGGEDIGTIFCTCQNTDEGLSIVIQDTGKRFVPEDVPAPDLESPLMERTAGGLGLFYIQAMMDEVEYEFSASGNKLTLFKRKS